MTSMIALFHPPQSLRSTLTTAFLTSLLSLSAEQTLSEAPRIPNAPEGMVFISGGTYTRGEDRRLGGTARYPEEQPLSLIHI